MLREMSDIFGETEANGPVTAWASPSPPQTLPDVYRKTAASGLNSPVVNLSMAGTATLCYVPRSGTNTASSRSSSVASMKSGPRVRVQRSEIIEGERSGERSGISLLSLGDARLSSGSLNQSLTTVPAPTVWEGARPQMLPLLGPLVLLLIAVVVTFAALRPSAEAQCYMGVYLALTVLSTLWIFGALVHTTRNLVVAMADQVQEVVGCDAEQLPSILSLDPRIRYVQASVYNAGVSPMLRTVDENPLHFVQKDIARHESSEHGYVVINGIGSILWCNPALSQFFGYDHGALVTENVRALMPPPYCHQHDAILMRYERGQQKKIVGCVRRVPVVRKDGSLTTIVLAVEEKIDPADTTSSVFMGQMRFGDSADEPDPATTLQQHLDRGETNVTRCCSALDSHPENILVIETTGIIQYANDAVTLMLDYDYGELVGRNVSCLMGDQHAKAHDDVLRRYVDKVTKARVVGRQIESQVVGKGRDFYARTKNGRMLRIFLTVKQVDRPSHDPKECLLVGTLLLIQQARTGQDSTHRSNQDTNSVLSGGSGSGHGTHRLVLQTQRKCTVIVVQVHGLDKGTPEGVCPDLQALLNVLGHLARKHKAKLETFMGERLVLTLNAEMPNNAHRGAAGLIIHQTLSMWHSAKKHSPLRLAIAAASTDCLIGAHGKYTIVLSKCFDVCAALLAVHTEASVRNAVIDQPLYEELQYAFECRRINALTFAASHSPGRSMWVYELLSTKHMEDDEWMYQISQTEKKDALAPWRDCWEALGGDRAGCGTADFVLAARFLQQHLQDKPEDGPARWLAAVVEQQRGRRGAARPLEAAGALRYQMAFKLGPT